MSKPEKKIVLQVTGSIAAFKAASLASLLVEAGSEVQVVVSAGARHFIGDSTFEGLTGRPVLNIPSEFPAGVMEQFLVGDFRGAMELPPKEHYDIRRVAELFLELCLSPQ